MTRSDGPAPEILEGNLRRFIWFRLFFNARFYYPVFTILYLDYGLSLEQFAILNLIWALTIVLAEVPSGALADLIGRKRLLVFAAFLMFIEMGLLTVVPIGTSTLLFVVFLINRIFSGLAEAAASGADEALAYDSLKALGREKDWPHLLEKTTRVVSIGFFVTMITGALSYDEQVMNTFLGFLNKDWELQKETIIRFPIILCLATSCIVIFTTLGMREIEPTGEQAPKAERLGWRVIIKPFKQILAAAGWTLNHRFVLFVILAALAIDSVARQFVVLASEYYRIIDIPPAWFGFIGAGMSLLGIVNARISRYLVTHHSPFFNYLVLSAILLVGLTGILFTIPWFGVFFAIGAFAMMGMVNYQSSYYINREVDSSKRATVLSFRGLALNLGLGLASLFYTGLIAALKAREEAGLSPEALQESVFIDSLKAFPVYFLFLFALVIVFGRMFIRRSQLCFQVGNESKSPS
ncbi:MFS transporter [Puniceicoccales bacterium CK1056]|uniref:MFS transporter n=1 Tax=Oceanipulchritudo coccoides TaxID=2706888 RepID=A0A6B2M230_9BACT|nr:MFS transporter [Oceanipulchritudo coccoides]NDV62436.1 MFS transporter [Oceanipulchritudo coccoides]